MKIKATRTFLNDIGVVRRGSEVDIRAVQAKSLIQRGLAVEVKKPVKKKPEGAAAPDKGE